MKSGLEEMAETSDCEAALQVDAGREVDDPLGQLEAGF